MPFIPSRFVPTPTPELLKSLTIGTCLFGGYLWTSKHYEGERNLLSKEQCSSSYNQRANSIQFWDSPTTKTVMSVLYSFVALNANSILEFAMTKLFALAIQQF